MTQTMYYVFDPLCGWCYGASAAVERLAAEARIGLRLLPSGLFADGGARTMDDGFAAYAWSNDLRIQRLTGETFSERYRQKVLADRDQAFDSGPATRALTAVALTAPEREAQALRAIQRARYVDGADITRQDTLAGVLQAQGLAAAALRLSLPDEALRQAAAERVSRAQVLLQQLGASGVPSFILEQDGQRRLLNTRVLYSEPQAFLDQLV